MSMGTFSVHDVYALVRGKRAVVLAYCIMCDTFEHLNRRQRVSFLTRENVATMRNEIRLINDKNKVQKKCNVQYTYLGSIQWIRRSRHIAFHPPVDGQTIIYFLPPLLVPFRALLCYTHTPSLAPSTAPLPPLCACRSTNIINHHPLDQETFVVVDFGCYNSRSSNLIDSTLTQREQVNHEGERRWMYIVDCVF